ncbi:MAG: hypothetical protein L6R41_006014 [Letrouitia leprolyta]|nr:MAG: hypothetical protein L6R41_006014 [Letrouitia leprolyta]
MDFFGNVQDVEVERGGWNESEWREDLRRLQEVVERRDGSQGREETVQQQLVDSATPSKKGREGAAKVEAGSGWSQQFLGVATMTRLAHSSS